MHNLLYRLSIALCGSAMAIGFSCSVLAKPQPVSKVVSATLPNKSPVTNDISRQPVDAVLANVRNRATTAKVGRTKPTIRVTKANRSAPTARSLNGISHLTDNTDRNPTNVSPVDRLIK